MKSNKYVCIFGGGAIRGVAYVGAIKALQELEIRSDTLVGSSVGSIFASLYALGYQPETLREIFHDFNAFMFKDINFTIGPDFAFSKGDIFEGWIREHIEKKYYGSKYAKGENPPVTFRDLKTDLYICSTDLKTNNQFIFSKYKTPDFEIAKAVRISACFPGLMKPVEYDGKFLVDGDLAKSLPLWKSSNELMQPDSRILEFRLEGCRNCLNLKTVFDYFNTVYSSISNFCSEHIIQMYNDKDKFDYVLIDTKDVLLLDFQMQNDVKDKIAQNGYDTTMKYFTETLVDKKKKLLPLYKTTLEMMRELRPMIKKGKAESAKRIFMNFVCEMTNEYENLDTTFMDDLKKFKITFLKDIKRHGILPINSIEHQVEHAKVLQGLIERCEFKVQDFEEYIQKYGKHYLP